MNGDKQIEEMAKILVKNSYLCKGEYIRTTGKHNRDHCESCDLKRACLNYGSAIDLYNAGYRKASEVARELIDDIIEALQGEIDAEDKLETTAWNESDTVGYHIHQYAEDKLDTLKIAFSLYKKKYESEEEKNGTDN